MTDVSELRVDRRDLRRCEIAERSIECGVGEAVLAVERFALTANNVSYAVAGDAMNYWKFFPAPDPWGCVPVWGFGRVVESRCAGVTVGDRYYGYFPMATHLAVAPMRLSSQGFVDGAAHRAGLAAVYNQYRKVGAAAREAEDAEMLLRPLFMTSFLIDDFLDDNGFFGSRAVLLSSASSKTSIALAFELSRKRQDAVACIGLTSAANVDFVERLGYYAHTLTYEAIASLDPAVATVFVDVAGDSRVLRRVHEHFGPALRHSCLVGATHWEGRDSGGRGPLPGVAPALFFAPSHIQKRHADWGPGGLETRIATDWSAFVADTRRWLRVEDVRGPRAMRTAYLEMLEGRTGPERGIVIAPAG
jgi:hypothetical protein